MTTDEEAHEKDYGTAVTGDQNLIDAITKHVERHIGPVATVFHEIHTEVVHIDILFVAPTPERNFHTLVTCGMSSLPMQAPEELADEENDRRYAEIMLCLPAEWPLSKESFEDPNNFWPIQWLKQLAQLPHYHDIWMNVWDTIPNDAEALPFAANTELGCWMLISPLLAPDEFSELEYNGRIINFYGAMALHRDEMEAKIAGNVEELVDGIDRNGVTELLEIDRPSVLASKG